MAVAHRAVAVCTDLATQAGIWRGCDLLFPSLWLVLLLLVVCEILFCWHLGRHSGPHLLFALPA